MQKGVSLLESHRDYYEHSKQSTVRLLLNWYKQYKQAKVQLSALIGVSDGSK
jgi:hypothetical protein